MRGKIILIGLLMLGSIAVNVRAEEIKLQPIDFSHPAVKATVALQEARGRGEFEVLWEQLSKKTQEIWGPSSFREFRLSPQGKKADALTSKASLAGIRVITENRIWVEASSPDLPLFRGFYFVKEEGIWKFAHMDRYRNKVEKDLDSLSNSISDYYKKNKKLPQSLSELSIDIPADLFSDSNAPYKYKVMDDVTYIVYSLGPDSDDDKGLLKHNRKDHPISDGDIVKQVAVQQ